MKSSASTRCAPALYRADQHSYILYPDRDVASFLSRNTLPADWRTRAPQLSAMADAGDTSLIVLDADGSAHFHADLTNAADLARRMNASDASARAAVLALWEDVFHHSRFTGRSRATDSRYA